MHIQTHFEMSEADSFAMLQKHSFGQLITSTNGQITQTYVPFVIDQQNHCLYGHIAKQNKQVELLEIADDLTVTFLGNNTYISPNWYQSSQQVPTWNYQAVEIKGKAALFDKEKTLKVIDELSQLHEAQFDTPWTMDKLSDKKLNAMLNAIVGFKIDIVEINGQSKLSQNKSVEDRVSVINGLGEMREQTSHRIAKMIKEEITNMENRS